MAYAVLRRMAQTCDGRRGCGSCVQPWLSPRPRGKTRSLLGRGTRWTQSYSGSYGDQTIVVRMHSGNGVHEEMDRRAIACFDLAMADVGIADDDVLRQVLHDYFAWATTTTMTRYHQSADDVPKGLSVPKWSWEGLQK